MTTQATLDGVPIVCLGFAEWDAELQTNQHHLMSRLAPSAPVLFIESLGLRKPTVSGRDVRRVAKRLRRGIRPLRRVDDVYVLSPLVVPLHESPFVRRLNRAILRRSVRRAQQRLSLARPILWAYVPQARELVEPLDPRLVVYHCVDNIGAQDRVDSASFDEAERDFVARADLVIASSRPIHERLARQRPDVRLMENVADTRLFSTALDPGHPVDPAVAALPEPRIVFVGAISAAKLDLPLIRDLAVQRPEWSIVLVGPIGLGDPGTDIAAVQTAHNVHLVGPRPHEALPSVLAAAHVGIVPYRLTELTRGIFPMKIYEYLAAGLPVVSTPLPALCGVDGLEFAATAPEMVATIEKLMNADSPDARARRSQGALGSSWDARIRELERAVEEVGWRPS